MGRKSKVITIQYSCATKDIFHYRVIKWKGNKALIGWADGEEDNACDITDLSDLSLYQLNMLYRKLARFGHLLDLEWTVERQEPMFADNSWTIARFLGQMEKE